MPSQILAWLDAHESAISAIVGITVLAGLVIGALRSLSTSRGGRAAALAEEEAARRISKTPSDLTLAILPVSSTGEDMLLAGFADALTLDLETFLARSSFLAVVVPDAQAASESDRLAELDGQGVQYALTMKMRRIQGEVRTSAQLVESRSGDHLWSDHFDLSAGEIETSSDDLAHLIANQLVVPILEEEGRRFTESGVESLDAQTLTRLAYTEFLFCNRHNRAVFEQTRRLLDRALSLDPANARAYAIRAASTSTCVTFGLSDDPARDEATSYRDAEQAMRLAPSDALSLWGRAWPSGYFEGFAVGLPFMERAVAADPNNAHIRADYGFMLGQVGRVEEAIIQVEAAFRLSPNDPRQYIWYGFRSILEIRRGDLDQAIEYADRGIQFGQYVPAYNAKIVAHLVRGDRALARETVERLAEVVEWEEPERHYREFMARATPAGPFQEKIFEVGSPWPEPKPRPIRLKPDASKGAYRFGRIIKAAAG